MIEARSLEHTRLVIITTGDYDGNICEKYFGGPHERGGAVWTDLLAEAKIYTNINAARSMLKALRKRSSGPGAAEMVTINIKLMPKKDIMIARIKGNE